MPAYPLPISTPLRAYTRSGKRYLISDLREHNNAVRHAIQRQRQRQAAETIKRNPQRDTLTGERYVLDPATGVLTRC